MRRIFFYLIFVLYGLIGSASLAYADTWHSLINNGNFSSWDDSHHPASWTVYTLSTNPFTQSTTTTCHSSSTCSLTQVYAYTGGPDSINQRQTRPVDEVFDASFWYYPQQDDSGIHHVCMFIMDSPDLNTPNHYWHATAHTWDSYTNFGNLQANAYVCDTYSTSTLNQWHQARWMALADAFPTTPPATTSFYFYITGGKNTEADPNAADGHQKFLLDDADWGYYTLDATSSTSTALISFRTSTVLFSYFLNQYSYPLLGIAGILLSLAFFVMIMEAFRGLGRRHNLG